MELTGKGIGVAVLDTGIYPHPDFGGRIVAFADFVNNKRRPYDDNGHGTHVAGIIAGSGKQSLGKYRGMAPASHLIAVKILDHKGNGRLRDVLKALDWICRNKEKYNIRIVNISVGTMGNSDWKNIQMNNAVDHAWDEGLVVVTAAGNMGPKPGTITAPGSSRKVITVGASDMLSSRDGMSGVGPTRECICKPDIVMPGANVISCSPEGYQKKSGTSMATPKVSGAIALLLEKDPYLTNLEVKMLLRQSAVDMGFARNRQGWGILDVNCLLGLQADTQSPF